MAINFSSPKGFRSFAISKDLLTQDIEGASSSDLRQLTEDVALKILGAFFHNKEQSSQELQATHFSEELLSLSSTSDWRADCIGTLSIFDDEKFQQTFDTHQLKLLLELFNTYQEGQLLTLPEFLTCVIARLWDKLPEDFPYKKETFLANFWKFYASGHIVATLFIYTAQHQESEDFITNFITYPLPGTTLREFVSLLLSVTQAISKLSNPSAETKDIITALQLLTRLTLKHNTLFFSDSLLGYYPKDSQPLKLQHMQPALKLFHDLLHSIQSLHSHELLETIQQLLTLTKILETHVEILSQDSPSKEAAFSETVNVLVKVFNTLQKASLFHEDTLAKLTLKAKNKERRAATCLDISCIRLLQNMFKGVMDAAEYSGFYYPMQHLCKRIFSTMEVSLNASSCFQTISTQIAYKIPEWAEIVLACGNLNLENPEKSALANQKEFELSDPSNIYACLKKPYLELSTSQEYLTCHELESYIEKIIEIRKRALEILEKIPEELKNDSLQELISSELRTYLTMNFLEFSLLRDIKHLTTNKNLLITDYIPDEFFDLLSLQIPLTVKEQVKEQTLCEEFFEALTLDQTAQVEPAPTAAAEKKPLVSKETRSAKKSATPPAQAQEESLEEKAQRIKKAKKFRELEKILNSLNLRLEGQRGSHAMFTSASGATVVVPKHPGKDLKAGTLLSIAQQAMAAATPKSPK